MRFWFAMLLCALSWSASGEQVMDQATMEQIIKDNAASHGGQAGLLEFEYHGVRMAAISDAANDRMRILSPVANYADVGREHLDAMMEANFHKTLDSRYAVTGGVLYAVFIHRLSILEQQDIEHAMDQVANLVLSYGSEFTSGDLTFNPRQ